VSAIARCQFTSRQSRVRCQLEVLARRAQPRRLCRLCVPGNVERRCTRRTSGEGNRAPTGTCPRSGHGSLNRAYALVLAAQCSRIERTTRARNGTMVRVRARSVIFRRAFEPIRREVPPVFAHDQGDDRPATRSRENRTRCGARQPPMTWVHVSIHPELTTTIASTIPVRSVATVARRRSHAPEIASAAGAER